MAGSPTRSLLAGAAAIAGLTAASVLAIALATRDGPGAARRPDDPLPAPAPPPPAAIPVAQGAAPPSSSLPAGLLGQGVPVVVEREPPPPPPAPGSWEAVRVAARPGALGPLGAAVGRELNDLQPALSACFDEDAQARHGTEPYSTVRGGASVDDAGQPVLMLQLEAGGDQVRIVDAPVEARGGASDGLLACAQRVLRGKVLDVPTGRQAGRHRLLLPLAP